MTLPSEKEQLQNQIERKEAKLLDFQDAPQAKIDARVNTLTDGLQQTTFYPTEKGKRCMHTHLEKMKVGLQRDSDAWVRYRIAQFKTEINRLQTKLDNL